MNGISPPFWKPMTGTHSESDSSAESPKVSRNRDGISEKWDISKMLRKIACDCHPKKYILKSSHSSKVFRNSIFSRISSPKRLEQSSNKVLPVKLWKSSLFRSPSPNMKTFPGSSPVFSTISEIAPTTRSKPFSRASRQKNMKFIEGKRNFTFRIYYGFLKINKCSCVIMPLDRNNQNLHL